MVYFLINWDLLHTEYARTHVRSAPAKSSQRVRKNVSRFERTLVVAWFERKSPAETCLREFCKAFQRNYRLMHVWEVLLWANTNASCQRETKDNNLLCEFYSIAHCSGVFVCVYLPIWWRWFSLADTSLHPKSSRSKATPLCQPWTRMETSLSVTI